MCSVDRMAKIVDERIPPQEFSSSQSMFWVLKGIYNITNGLMYPSTIAFACGFLKLMELHEIP